MVTESSFEVHTRSFGTVMLEAKPIRAGRAVPPPIKARMIGENLDTGADDEHHEEEIEEMQQPQPQRKARVHRLRGRGDTGVARDEFLHAGHRPQLLGDGDSEDQENDDQRYRPQDIDRSAAQTDARDYALLRRQPVALTNTVIRGAQACRVVWLRRLARLLRTSHRRHTSLLHASLLHRCILRFDEAPMFARALSFRRGRSGLSLRLSSQQKVS